MCFITPEYTSLLILNDKIILFVIIYVIIIKNLGRWYLPRSFLRLSVN